ncbi:MAG TPA: hypothetical protein VHA37_02265 [Candidatus Saccharimonadales bacterium]|nr:hypothetical protein [Candidatus Saccharimonadales bacterium]
MLMVLIMHMAMLVLHRFVTVFVLVALAQMEPKAHCHEEGCGEQESRYLFV